MPVTGKRQIQHAKMPKNAKGRFKKRQFFSPLWVVELEHFSAYLGLSHAIFRKTLSCNAGSCSIKRDARALLSLCVMHCLRERDQIDIKSKTSDKTTPPFLVCHWYRSYCPRVIHFFEFYESEKKGSLLTIYRGV
jgi:hypothetical protein